MDVLLFKLAITKINIKQRGDVIADAIHGQCTTWPMQYMAKAVDF